MPHTGVETLLRPEVRVAAFQMLETIFPYIPRRWNSKTPRKVSRNEIIRQRFAAGEPMSDLSSEYGISRQRISQIVHRRRR